MAISTLKRYYCPIPTFIRINLYLLRLFFKIYFRSLLTIHIITLIFCFSSVKYLMISVIDRLPFCLLEYSQVFYVIDQLALFQISEVHQLGRYD